MASRNGVFIVIDGTDGSGKKTQTDLLVARLEKEGYPVRLVRFPRYGEKSAALVELYLSGAFGVTPDKVDPYIASAAYALDRLATAPEIKAALAQGSMVVADRYVAANMGHQGAKFKDEKTLKEYLVWLDNFEYGRGQIPKPDLNIILHVPTEISLRLVETRGEKKDIHEEDPEHLRAAERTYLAIAELFDDYVSVECVRDGEIMDRQEIHELIWRNVRETVGE